jgi:hypothetical protein
MKDEVNDIRLRVASEVKAHFAPEALSFSAVPPNISPAQSMFKRLQKQILDFEAKLNDDQEIAVRLVSFSDSQVFHIQGMGYHGPDIITFVAVSPEGEHPRGTRSTYSARVSIKRPTHRCEEAGAKAPAHRVCIVSTVADTAEIECAYAVVGAPRCQFEPSDRAPRGVSVLRRFPSGSGSDICTVSHTASSLMSK